MLDGGIRHVGWGYKTCWMGYFAYICCEASHQATGSPLITGHTRIHPSAMATWHRFKAIGDADMESRYGPTSFQRCRPGHCDLSLLMSVHTHPYTCLDKYLCTCLYTCMYACQDTGRDKGRHRVPSWSRRIDRRCAHPTHAGALDTLHAMPHGMLHRILCCMPHGMPHGVDMVCCPHGVDMVCCMVCRMVLTWYAAWYAAWCGAR